jgi:hypothetical protein
VAYKVIAVKSVHEILDFCENSDEASLEGCAKRTIRFGVFPSDLIVSIKDRISLLRIT